MAGSASGVAGLRGLLARFSRQLHQAGVNSAKCRVAVALSGGPDSLALAGLTAWWQGFAKAKDTPLALIVDHGLREGSAAEAAAVAHQAASLGLHPHVLTLDWGGVPPRTADKMPAARERRYEALAAACRQYGRSHLLVAHHADDQVETFLLRLFRASGVQGLACMPLVGPLLGGHTDLRVVRPLLGMRKTDLEGYCRQRGLEYVEDPTNADLAHHRNLIRHVLTTLPPPPPPPLIGLAGQQQLAALPSQLQEQQQPEGAALHAAAPGGGSSRGDGSGLEQQQQQQPDIISDLLRLQQRCAHAHGQQLRASDRALRAAVLHTNTQLLHDTHHHHSSSSSSSSRNSSSYGSGVRQGSFQVLESQQYPGSSRWRTDPSATAEGAPEMVGEWEGQAGPGSRHSHRRRRSNSRIISSSYSTQPWWVNWREELESMAEVLGEHDIRYALVYMPALGRAPEAAWLGALSRLMLAMSGNSYPPSLRELRKLRDCIEEGGRMGRGFAGSGCVARPLVGSKGRYALFLCQWQQEEAREVLDAWKQQRKQQGAAAVAAVAAEEAAAAGVEEEAAAEAAAAAQAVVMRQRRVPVPWWKQRRRKLQGQAGQQAEQQPVAG